MRYACLGHDLGKGTTPPEILPQHLRHEERSVALVRAMSERLRVDNACRALAEVTAREHGNVHRSGEFGAAALVRLLERCDACAGPTASPRCCSPANAMPAAGSASRSGLSAAGAPDRSLAAGPAAVDATAVAAAASARGASGPAIGQAIHDARVERCAISSRRSACASAPRAPR